MKTYYSIPASTYMSKFISPVIWTTITTKSSNKNKLLNSLLIKIKIHTYAQEAMLYKITQPNTFTVTRVRTELQHLHNCNFHSEVIYHQHYRLLLHLEDNATTKCYGNIASTGQFSSCLWITFTTWRGLYGSEAFTVSGDGGGWECIIE
jgi:hypothetical protein